MKIITGNDLRTGAAIWWDGTGWSRHVSHAIDAGDGAALIIATEQAARRVVGAYTVEAGRDATGVRPAHIKERIRALGPTVRLDLCLQPADPTAGDWVI